MAQSSKKLGDSYATFVENISTGLARTMGMFEENMHDMINKLGKQLAGYAAQSEGKGGQVVELSGISKMQQAMADMTTALNRAVTAIEQMAGCVNVTSMRKRRRIRLIRSDMGSYWISFSDMLSSLLLVFILAVTFSIYQYYNLLEIKTRELDAQKAELDRTQITLTQREDLRTAQVTLMGKEEELATIQIQLDQQKSDLHAAQTALKTKEEEQALLQLQLTAQADALASQEIRLGAMQEALSSQQAVGRPAGCAHRDYPGFVRCADTGGRGGQGRQNDGRYYIGQPAHV